LTAFVVACALMLGIALALVLRPLLRATGDPQLARKRAALEAAKAAGVIDADEYASKLGALGSAAATTPPRAPLALALGVAVVLAGGAMLVYRVVGEPRALDPQAHVRRDGGESHAGQAPSIDEAIAGLEQRLQGEPGDVEGWTLLGRAYKATQRFAEARGALDKARALAPQEPTLMVEYAEAIALANPERKFDGEARGLLEQALTIEPNHQRGLWLLGISEAQAQNYAAAVVAWEKLQPMLEPGSDVARSVATQIAEARQRAGVALAEAPARRVGASAPPTATTTATGTAESATAADAPRLTVRIDIAPALKGRLAPSDVLYVFARLPQGPRMPLAIQRVPAPAFPLSVTLDDSMGMLPTLKLSSAEQVVVGARVSKTGNAQPQSGDFEVISAPLALKEQAAPIELVIDAIVP
jgi:cytochrome c-type biogenesis protein CcmH